MRRLPPGLLLLAALAAPASEAASEDWLYVKAAPSAVARAGPGLEYPAVGPVPQRTRVRLLGALPEVVEIEGEAGRWAQVRWAGGEGWVFDRCLSFVPPLTLAEARAQLCRTPVRCGAARLRLAPGGTGSGRLEPAGAAVRNVRWWGQAPFYAAFEEWGVRAGAPAQLGLGLCELVHDEALGRFVGRELDLGRGTGPPFANLGLPTACSGGPGPDCPPAHAAASRGDLEALRATPPTLEVRSRWGWTALHHAAAQGQAAAVAWLLAAGANPAAKANDGCAPLHLAAGAGRDEVVALLLRRRLDRGDPDREGRTALHWAAEAGHAGVVRLLVAGGAPLEAADHLGRTPLWYAAHRARLPTLQGLLAAGASARARDRDGATPLHAAAAACEAQAVRLLLVAGGDPAARDAYGLTALQHAYFARCDPVPPGLEASTPGR